MFMGQKLTCSCFFCLFSIVYYVINMRSIISTYTIVTVLWSKDCIKTLNLQRTAYFPRRWNKLRITTSRQSLLYIHISRERVFFLLCRFGTCFNNILQNTNQRWTSYNLKYSIYRATVYRCLLLESANRTSVYISCMPHRIIIRRKHNPNRDILVK